MIGFRYISVNTLHKGDDDDDDDDDDDNNNSNYKICYYRSIIIDRKIRNNRPDVAIIDKTITEAYPIDVAIPTSHSLHSTITAKLQQ
jgi:predicted glycosyltransferase